jgi:hypothetical protein
METIRLFDTTQHARDYRHQNGTGGWIFEPTASFNEHYHWHQSVLFPPSMTPAQIFNHPMTKGRDGRLLAN